jgi:hypothetical protein
MTSNWRARGMPKQRQSLATRPVPVLTVEFAFAPSAIPPATFSACLAAVSPTQAPAHINGPIYRNGNAAEMGTAQGELGDGKSILRSPRGDVSGGLLGQFEVPPSPSLHSPDQHDPLLSH